jgi:hypothetical protein
MTAARRLLALGPRSGITAALVASLLGSTPVPPVRAEAPPATASMQCEPNAEPGRVRCTVEARARTGAVIRWGDVVIAAAPERMAPLRGRISPAEATTRDDGVWRWGLALVARERGTFDVRVRARLVVCEADRCAPFEVEAAVPVVVGR